MSELPFKVRNKEPQVILVKRDTKVPAVVRNERFGTNALTYKGKVYVFNKNVPKKVLDHEKSHCSAEKSHVVSPKGVMAWLEDELRADLVTYQKSGEPERIYDRLNSRASDARMYHMDGDTHDWYNYYEQSKHSVEHIERVYRKYWDYLPSQWKKDYIKFIEHSYQKLGKLREQGRNCNPPKDYCVRRFPSGNYDVKKKRVIRKRDSVTGFMVKGVK